MADNKVTEKNFVPTEPPPPPFIIHQQEDDVTTTTTDGNGNPATEQPHQLQRIPGRFQHPRHVSDDHVSDIEDIVIRNIARPRPDRIKWLCTFRRRLIPGEEYQWCQCGKSEDIYCDETCKTEPTKLGPLKFSVVNKVSQHGLCGCRYTQTPPFCDGCHIFPQKSVEEWIEAHPEDADKQWWLNCVSSNCSDGDRAKCQGNDHCSKHGGGDEKCKGDADATTATNTVTAATTTTSCKDDTTE